MLQVFYLAHWGIPWLILVVGMYTIIKFARGFIDKRPYTPADHRLFTIFRDLLKIQGVTGIIYSVWSELITHHPPAYLFSHALTMLIAVIILPLASRWKNEDDATRYINTFGLMLASFLIMLVGLALVPNAANR